MSLIAIDEGITQPGAAYPRVAEVRLEAEHWSYFASGSVEEFQEHGTPLEITGHLDLALRRRSERQLSLLVSLEAGTHVEARRGRGSDDYRPLSKRVNHR